MKNPPKPFSKGCDFCKGMCQIKWNSGDPTWVCQSCHRMQGRYLGRLGRTGKLLRED